MSSGRPSTVHRFLTSCQFVKLMLGMFHARTKNQSVTKLTNRKCFNIKEINFEYPILYLN